MKSNRNRTAGHNWERDCCELLRHIFPNCVTTRSANLRLDAKKVDLCNEDGTKLPINVQCKTLKEGTFNLNKILGEMPVDEFNVIFLKVTHKSQNGRFIPLRHLAIVKINNELQNMRLADIYDVNRKKNIVSFYLENFISYLEERFSN